MGEAPILQSRGGDPQRAAALRVRAARLAVRKAAVNVRTSVETLGSTLSEFIGSQAATVSRDGNGATAKHLCEP